MLHALCKKSSRIGGQNLEDRTKVQNGSRRVTNLVFVNCGPILPT